MFILYDLIFLIFAILYLPVFLLRGKLHRGFEQRLGFLPKGPRLEKPVWLHAVSVGEAASIRHLVEELRQDFPGKQFVFSTVTPTGNSVVSSVASASDLVTYLPLDLSFVVGIFFSKIKPSALVIVETEIWPNLIYAAAKRRIPVIFVNGRISDGSFRWYRAVKLLIAPLLNGVSAFCVQSQQDEERLALLGVDTRKIRITGNMKFDIRVKDYQELKNDYRDYRQSAGIGSSERLWVAASTHRGEEQIVLEAFLRLAKTFPHLRLLIAPRHPERSAEVGAAVLQAGLKPLPISSIGKKGAFTESSGKEVFILDCVGQLMYFYAISDIVFVGGSLVRTGGHNILEPASLGKPVLFGPYMFNFSEIAALFLQRNAAVRVTDGKGLAESMSRLLGENSRASEFAASARRIIEENKGATFRNREIIRNIIAPGA